MARQNLDNGAQGLISRNKLNNNFIELYAHLAATADAHTASAITFVPGGSGMLSTDVNDAIIEAYNNAAGGGTVLRFQDKDEIYFLLVGQSNAGQYQVATVGNRTPYDARVKFVQSINKAVAGTQSTDPTDFELYSPHPTDPMVLDHGANWTDNPYIGHPLGGTGNNIHQMAYETAVRENKGVTVLMITWGGANLTQFNVGGPVHDLLLDFFPVFFDRPADVWNWRQGETDAALAYTALQYNTEYSAMRASLEAADILGPDTLHFIAEPTAYFNETGPSAYHFEGPRAVVRYGGANHYLTSTVGVSYVSGDEIHFDGDGNISIGSTQTKQLYGLLPSSSAVSSEFGRDRNPKATGNLNMNGKNLTNCLALTATTGNITTLNGTTANVTTGNFTDLNATNDTTIADFLTSTGIFFTMVPASGSARGYVLDTTTDYSADTDRIIELKTNAVSRAYLTGVGRFHARTLDARTFTTDIASIVPSVDLSITAYFSSNMTVQGYTGTNAGTYLSSVASGSSSVSYDYDTTADLTHSGALHSRWRRFTSVIMALSKDGALALAAGINATTAVFSGAATMAAVTASGLITANAGLTGTILTATTRVTTPLQYATIGEASGVYQQKFDSNATWSTYPIWGIFNGGGHVLDLNWDGKWLNTTANQSVNIGLGFIPHASSPGDYFEFSNASNNGIGTLKWFGTIGMTLNSNVADGGVAVRIRPSSAMASGTLFAISNVTGSSNRVTVSFDGNLTAKLLSNSVVSVSGTSGTFVTGSGSTAVMNGTVVASNTGTVDITLPSAASYPGSIFTLKKSGASGNTRLNSTGGELFDGIGGPITISTAGHLIQVQSDGTGWLRLKVGSF